MTPVNAVDTAAARLEVAFVCTHGCTGRELGDGRRKQGRDFFGGVLQNIAANVLAAAIGGLCVAWGLAEKEKLEDPVNWPLWLALFGSIFFIAGAVNAIRLWVKRKWAREKIEKPPTDRIGILIAELEDDLPTHAVRKNIADSLRRELGHAADIKV